MATETGRDELATERTIRIGVTGHRDLGDDGSIARIRQVVKVILATLRGPTDTPVRDLRVISALAEGADQIVAEEGCELGIDLHVVLPFARDEYRKDFSGPSEERFDRLLTTASRVLELANPRSLDGGAYEVAGHVMLEHADLLIAIWDGDEARGRGGTGQIVEEALRVGIPVVWIDPGDDCSTRITQPGAGRFETVNDASLTDGILAMAQTVAPSDSNMAEVDACLRMPRPGWHPSRALALSWRLIFNALAGSAPPGDEAPGPPAPPMPPRYQRIFERADFFATHFTQLYRGSFLANYLLAAAAVSCAIVLLVLEGKHAAHPEEPLGFAIPAMMVAELLCVSLIITITVMANKRRWHERAIDYRYLAEQLRQLRYLGPLGLVTPSSRPPVHHSEGDPRSSWMTTLFQIIVSREGLPNHVVDTAMLDTWRASFRNDAVRGQRRYHVANAHRMHTFHHRLHVLGMALFCITATAVAVHVIVMPIGDLGHSFAWLTIVTALLPTWGAALLAMMNHGEFERVERRSDSMSRFLDQIDAELDASSESMGITECNTIARSVSGACMDEVADWRIVFSVRPIRPPA